MATVNFFRILLWLLEVAACIAGFVAMPRLKNSFWKWLPFYLLTMVLGETLGYYLSFVPTLRQYNPMLFNYFLLPLQIIFFNWLLYKNIGLYKAAQKKWVLYGMAIYLACLLIDWFFIPNTSLWVITFSSSIGMLILLSAILLFFYHYINSSDIIIFKKDMVFWICLGLFLYYVGTLPFEGLRNTLFKYPNLFLLCWYINMGLACLMYVSFIISFVWARPR